MEKSDRLVLIMLVGGVLVLLLWMMRAANLFPTSGVPRAGFGIGPGEIAPPLKADGWINGDPPTEAALRGKVVVVDAWAHWCVPCLQRAPELVELHQHFQGEDVVFIGLTAEDESALSLSRQFVETAGITWPNGYGATETLIQFGGDYLPMAWVIGRDGKVTWNSGMAHYISMQSAIERALAAPPPVSAASDTDEPASSKPPDRADSSPSPAESTP